jgi:hypothetical protein
VQVKYHGLEWRVESGSIKPTEVTSIGLCRRNILVWSGGWRVAVPNQQKYKYRTVQGKYPGLEWRVESGSTMRSAAGYSSPLLTDTSHSYSSIFTRRQVLIPYSLFTYNSAIERSNICIRVSIYFIQRGSAMCSHWKDTIPNI